MAKREIILDTETTGFGDKQQDGSWQVGSQRLCSFAALEMIDGKLTGQAFYSHVNPEREPEPEASKVNGLTLDILSDKPLFRDVARELRDFIGDSTVVITCWTMEGGYVLDVEFLNKELKDAGIEDIPATQWLNVRKWGEEMFGHKEASLNKVLTRYGIDTEGRELHSGHNAVKDARMLAAVYPRLREDYESFTGARKSPSHDPEPR